MAELTFAVVIIEAVKVGPDADGKRHVEFVGRRYQTGLTIGRAQWVAERIIENGGRAVIEPEVPAAAE